MPQPLSQADAPVRPTARRAAVSVNSVSTRIIVCVLTATVLTAAIVSGLAVRAIHDDQARRLTRAFAELASARAQSFSDRRSELAGQLAASAAPGSPWQAELARVRAAADRGEPPALRWQGPVGTAPAENELETILDGELPAPPAELAERFDALVLDDPGASPSLPEDCLAIEADVAVAPGGAPARLTGCAAVEALADLMTPPGAMTPVPRIVVTDLRGVVLAVGGPGAPTRQRTRLPIAELIGAGSARLSDYSDTAGRALIGLATPLGRTGFFLVVETEHARAFAAAIEATRTIFVVDVCVILLFSVLAYKVTQAIMQPIHALSSGAQRILDGHVDHQIPLPAIHDDELGLLTHTFNAMMQKLRSNQVEIERDRVRLAEKNEELKSANEVLSQLSITDGLTKLHNHRYFQDHLTREIKRVSRTHAPLSLILIDIDDFKQLNDTHGHAAGDEVLISLASIMNESARESDLIARYGGEEFVILMPNTDLAGAVHLAEKIRMAVESTRLIIGDRLKPTDVTISLGVALFKGNRREFFAEADRALYRAKAAGKNCVIIAGSDAPALS